MVKKKKTKIIAKKAPKKKPVKKVKAKKKVFHKKAVRAAAQKPKEIPDTKRQMNMYKILKKEKLAENIYQMDVEAPDIAKIEAKTNICFIFRIREP